MNKQKITEVMNNTWQDGEEIVDALIRFIGDEATIIKILKQDLSSNRYECDAYTWSDLAYCLVNDVAWETMPYDDSDYINDLQLVMNHEDKCKQLLIANNWCIDTTTGIAICFDDEVTPICHEFKL